MSVRKDEKRNRWVATIECGEIKGKRRRKQKSFIRKKDAYQWEREMLNIAESADISKYDVTFNRLAEEFFAHKKQCGISGSTLSKNKSALRLVEKYPLYTKKARDIKMLEIEEMMNDLSKRYSKTYIMNIKHLASAIFNFGIDQDFIVKNPCRRASLPRHCQPGRENIDSFTKEEIAIIESFCDDLDFGDVVYVMLNTGLRSQELCAIDKDSLLMKEGKPYLIIDKALKRSITGTWSCGTTKTEKSQRTIPITSKVYSIILERIIKNKWQSFLPGNGKYMSYTQFYNQYNNFFKTLNTLSDTKVRPLSPHCCRHTFSSRCEWSGVPVTVTKELLGHTNVTMTYKYTHIMNDAMEEAIANII